VNFINKILARWSNKIISLGWKHHVEDQRQQFSIPQSVSFYAISIDGNVTFGEHTYINDFTRIDSGALSTVHIGRHCAIGRFVHITSKTHSLQQPTTDETNSAIKMEEKDVVIGNYVWIGDKATILPGVTIGDYAVIAAHSLVTADVKAFEVVGGTPAKHLRFNTEHNSYIHHKAT